VGNTLSYIILPMNNGTLTYFIVMLCIGGAGNVLFAFLPTIELNEE
jgi:hypothetical protein